MDSFIRCLCGPSPAMLSQSYGSDEENIAPEKLVYASCTSGYMPYRDDDPADQIVEIIRTAESTGKELRDKVDSIVSPAGWTDSLAQSILEKMENLVQTCASMGKAMADAVKRAEQVAWSFAKEHPIYAGLITAGTIIALGVLVIMAPGWILEALGFAARGPRFGSFAARWMSRIAQRNGGQVFEGSFYSYLQSLGMKLIK